MFILPNKFSISEHILINRSTAGGYFIICLVVLRKPSKCIYTLVIPMKVITLIIETFKYCLYLLICIQMWEKCLRFFSVCEMMCESVICVPWGQSDPNSVSWNHSLHPNWQKHRITQLLFMSCSKLQQQ